MAGYIKAGNTSEFKDGTKKKVILKRARNNAREGWRQLLCRE